VSTSLLQTRTAQAWRVARLGLALALAMSGLLAPSTRVLAQTVVATVGVGVNPLGVGVNPSTGRVYVANDGSNTVSVIDGNTNTVIATVGVGSQPEGVGVNPSTGRVYVANDGSNTVSVIDAHANTVIATIAVGSRPQGVGVNPSTGRVYVSNDASGTVSVIQDIGPVRTPGCAVTNHGRITANDSDKATFDGNAKASSDGKTVTGQEKYRDHGPAQPLAVKSLSIQAVVCNLSAKPKQASIFGQATIDGAGQHTYKLDVTDAGNPETNDTYRILLDTGYDSGVHKLQSGKVEIRQK
jgi:YVTN family beta-propeller protein